MAEAVGVEPGQQEKDTGFPRRTFALGLVLVNLFAPFVLVVGLFSLMLGGSLAVPLLVGVAPIFLLQPWTLPLVFLPFGAGIVFIPAAGSWLTLRIYQHPRGARIATALFGTPMRRRRAWVFSGVWVGGSFLWTVAAFTGFVPHPVEGVLDDKLEHLAIEPTRVRSFAYGGLLDRSGVFALDLPCEEVERLASGLGARDCSPDELPRGFFHQQPYWWKPTVGPGDRAFLSPFFAPDKRGIDGLHVAALWTARDQRLWIWFEDNW